MADINASFEYDANFGPAIAQIKSLAREISVLNNSFNSLDKTALAAKKQLAGTFQTNISSLGAFQTQIVDLSSDVDRFGEALQKNRLHMRDYFREARRAYTEGSRVRRLAVEQVRKAQSEIVSLGKDATGRNKGMMITPLSVDTSNIKTSMMIAREQFSIFNKLVQDGSRELINWGKNTQWAGRQLTVGLTVPLTIFGSTLSRTFRDFDRELTRFQKVYGSDLVNTTTTASNEMRKQVELLSKDIASKFGIAVSETAALAADLAATGLEGQRLTSSIEQTTRLSVLGEVNRQEAMKATLALQSAFNMSTQELAESINFLNAVENQTSVSIADLTEAIPRTGPVINALGGDVRDLAVLLVAMKEGGISAAEGANAIKSGMASLINPTKQASEVARGFGVDLEGIVTRNRGKLMPTILEFQSALQGLDDFARAQIIEQVFGKYQFARIAALFDNLNQSGSQTVQVIKLMSASSSELAATANAELRTLTESTSMRFQRAMESIKAALLPVGEALTSAVIPFLEKAADLFNKIVEYGRGLPEPLKNFLKISTGFTALAGPVVMIAGVLANFFGYVTKGTMGIVNLGRAISGMPTKQFELLNDEQIIALKTTDNLTAAYARQDSVLSKLNGTMSVYLAALRNQAITNPGMMMPGAKPIKRARGGGVPGSGNTDSVPALLMPGEFVVNKKATQKYGPIINAMNNGTIRGFEYGGIAGYNVDLSKINLKSVPALERELSIRPDLSNEIQQVFDEISTGLDKTKLNTAQVLEMINQKAAEAQKVPVSRAQENRYSAPSGIGTIEQQLKSERGEIEAQKELDKERAAASEVRKAMLKEAGLTEEDLLKEENKKIRNRINAYSQLDRSHIAEINKVQESREKEFAKWNSGLWKTSTGVDNLLLESLRSSSDNRSAYLANLKAVEKDPAIIASIENKITKGIALTDKELEVQKRVLERMLANINSFRTSPNFANMAKASVSAQTGRAKSGIIAPERDYVAASTTAATLAATTSARTVTRTKSPSVEGQKIGNDLGEGMFLGMQQYEDKVADGGENLGKASLTGMARAKQRASSVGRNVMARGASSANAVMGATIALNSIAMMNEGFANATGKLLNFTNALMVATSVMQLMQFANIGGMRKGMSSLGQRLSTRGGAMAARGGTTMAFAGRNAGALAQGAGRVAGGGLLRGAGAALSLLGGPAGIAIAAGIAAITFAIVKYKQAVANARKEGEAMYASQTAAAEYYGITLKSVNDQMKKNADTAKNLGLAGGVGTASGVDPSLKKAILDQEENQKLVEKLKSSSDPSSIFLGQYGKMLQQGFDPAQAKEILSVLAQASGTTGKLMGMSGTFSGITNARQATAAVGTSFTQNISSIFGQGTVSATDKARVQGAFSGIIESALLSEDLGQGLKVMSNSVSAAFAEGAKRGLTQSQVGETLGKSITSQMESLGLKQGDPIFDAIQGLGNTAKGTQDKMLAIQATAAGIDMSGFIADGKLVKSELDQISQKLAQIDAAAQIDLDLDKQLESEIAMLEEVKVKESARYDNLLAKNEQAKSAEEDRHKNFAKNIQKENKLLQKQIDQIQEGSDTYINAIEQENKAADFRQQQRQSALGGLSALSQGDVFGFIQAQQQMAAGAAQQGRQSELDIIKRQTEEAVKALKDQIDKNNELADGEDERHENRIKQLEEENAAIQSNKAATIQAIDAAVAQAQKLKDLAPGAALSADMNKYIGTLGTLANKLPPQAQKLVTDMAKTFNSDFNKIVNDAIATAGAEYGITDKSRLSQLIKTSIAGGAATFAGGNPKDFSKYASGGYVSGPGSNTSDSIPARLSNGEYVVKASSVQKYGTGLLNQINEQRFAKGGYVSATARGTQTGVAIGQGAVTQSAVISALGKVIGDALAAEEPENDYGAASGQIVADFKLLGQVARILLGSFGVTSRSIYPSGRAHSARYNNKAIDYATPMGTSVYAMADGLATVSDLGINSYGKYVSIRHNDGTESIYAHLSNFSIGSGPVRAGQRIGFTGNSGKSTGPHLHFEWSGLAPGANPPGMRMGGLTKSDGLARLHKGEAVLTAPLTKDLKDGVKAMKYIVPQQSNIPVDNSVTSSLVQYNINVSGTNMSNPKQVANQVVKAIKVEDKRRNFGRKVR